MEKLTEQTLNRFGIVYLHGLDIASFTDASLKNMFDGLVAKVAPKTTYLDTRDQEDFDKIYNELARRRATFNIGGIRGGIGDSF